MDLNSISMPLVLKPNPLRRLFFQKLSEKPRTPLGAKNPYVLASKSGLYRSSSVNTASTPPPCISTPRPDAYSPYCVFTNYDAVQLAYLDAAYTVFNQSDPSQFYVTYGVYNSTLKKYVPSSNQTQPSYPPSCY